MDEVPRPPAGASDLTAVHVPPEQPAGRLVAVLDDDPTGTQAVVDVPVLLSWDADTVRTAVRQHPRAVHFMTNVRAMRSSRAREVTKSAAEAARNHVPGARLVLRGDSTLRGHVYEEYDAIREVAFDGHDPVLLLVPALPAAGRVTRDGTHWLVRDGHTVALHETEYAHDGIFSYRSGHLLSWAEERSGGQIASERGTEVRLESLRERGPESVAEALTCAAESGVPAACVPDAETLSDLHVIAQGLQLAEERGVDVLVRCAPAFAGALAGTLAPALVTPRRPGERGLLVVCGSYVSGTTSQLSHLCDSLSTSPIEVDIVAMAGDGANSEAAAQQTARAAEAAIARTGWAVISTPRERPPGLTSVEAGLAIARGLARAVAAVAPRPAAVITKGGITSHVVLEHGLGARYAWVKGPVIPGVAEWEIPGDRTTSVFVFPGNVGGDDHLTRLVSSLLGAGA